MKRQQAAEPRRKPSQKRSRKRVEVILAATRSLLQEQGVAAITTTRIAERAGLPVGSIYQYFPDKTAIFANIYTDYLQAIQEVLLDWEHNGPYASGWRVFFGQLHKRLKRAEASGNLGSMLLADWQNYPELLTLNDQHAEVIAAATARMLHRFGSRWSSAKLRRLSLYIFRLNGAALLHNQRLENSRLVARETREWTETVVMTMLGSSLSD